jgi:hypothetical protein
MAKSMPMFDAILIFLAQGTMIFLFGIQSLNVNGGHKYLAAGTSLILGVLGFYVTGTVAKAYNDGLFTLFGLSFILAGPIAIWLAIELHPKIKKFLTR